MNSAIGDRHMLAWQTKSTSSTICTPLLGMIAARYATGTLVRPVRADVEGMPASYGVAGAAGRDAAPGARA